jgi:organic radical activating enzyme
MHADKVGHYYPGHDLMNKIKIQHLDIPIIRSCNLACIGCMTHSNHKKINGLVRIEESISWLKFWAEKVEPETITLFGGEPLLHPRFVDWALTVREIFGPAVNISVNTNGYYLDTLHNDIHRLFDDNVALSMVISKQTGTEPYLGKVTSSIESLKQAILDYRTSLPGVESAAWECWLDESDVNTKQWFRIRSNKDDTSRTGLTTCDQYKLSWCIHYTGTGTDMRPVYNYNDQWAAPNHARCQTNNFVTLFKGRMWKCPPMGVIEHTLETFDLTDHPDWAPFLDNYVTVGPESTDSEISDWFRRQSQPEQVCNMCGFEGPNSQEITSEARSHVLKNHWNYSV